MTIPLYLVRVQDASGVKKVAYWMAGEFGGSAEASVTHWFKTQRADRIGEFWVLPGEEPAPQLYKAPGVTPGYYFSMATSPQSPDEVEDIDSEFPMAVWKASGISDRHVFLALWTALVASIPKWLIAHQKPVDLGFVKLVAVPLRAHWKSHVMNMAPNLAHRLKTGGFQSISKLLCNAMMGEVIKSGTGYTFGWNIEAIPSARFIRYTKTVEAQRLTAYPGKQYIEQWGAILYRLKDQIVECLEYALTKSKFPAGAVIESGDDQCKRLAPRTGTNTVGPAFTDRIHIPDALTPGFPNPARKADPSDARISPRSLRKLSFVRADSGNLRIPRKDL